MGFEIIFLLIFKSVFSLVYWCSVTDMVCQGVYYVRSLLVLSLSRYHMYFFRQALSMNKCDLPYTVSIHFHSKSRNHHRTMHGQHKQLMHSRGILGNSCTYSVIAFRDFQKQFVSRSYRSITMLNSEAEELIMWKCA